MALVIEDGTGLTNATSFVTVQEFKDYAMARGLTVPADPAIEIAAIKAMDYFKTQENNFGGERLFPENPQALPFPRTGQYIYGELVPDGDIPPEVKDAQYAIMATINSGVELIPTTAERTLKRQKTGPLEKEWFEPGSTMPIVPLIDNAMAPLFDSGFGSFALVTRRI